MLPYTISMIGLMVTATARDIMALVIGIGQVVTSGADYLGLDTIPE